MLNGCSYFFPTAEAWTAFWTMCIFVATAFAAAFAFQAFRISRETFRRELSASLVVKPVLPGEQHESAVGRFLVVQDKNGAPEIRPPAHGDSPLTRARLPDEPNIISNPHYGGQPNWERLSVRLINLGRAPAVDVRLTVRFKLKPKIDALNTDPKTPGTRWEAGVDYPAPLSSATDWANGVIAIDLIPPGAEVVIDVENRYNAELALSPLKALAFDRSDAQGRRHYADVSMLSLKTPFAIGRTILADDVSSKMGPH